MQSRSVEAICPELERRSLDETLRRAQQGSAEAFDRLFDALSPQFTAWLRRRYCRDDDSASSVLQEAWVAAWSKLSAFNSGAHLRQWMYRVARNVAVSGIRRSCLHSKAIDRLSAELDPRIDRGRRMRQESEPACGESLEKPLQALASGYRMVSVLYYFHDLSTHEIAGLLGLSRPTVKMRLLRARRQIRASMKA